MVNVRFWQYINGDFVKFTLRPDQDLSHRHYEATDEGYEVEYNVWSFDGETITNEVTIRSQDCDGRMSREYNYHCGINDLRGYNPNHHADYGNDILTPKWTEGKYSQRDYSAEAMGY